MGRILKCINFQSKYIMKTVLYFLAGYTLFYMGIVLLNIVLTKGNPTNYVNLNSGFVIAGAIFAFASVSSDYKTKHNYLLMLGNTRKNIFLSHFVGNVMMSAILSIAALLSNLAENIVSRYSAHIQSSNILLWIYKEHVNVTTSFIWYFMLFAFISAFASLFGSLSYKFGRKFIVPFWIVSGLSFMFFLSAAAINAPAWMMQIYRHYFGVGKPYGIMAASLNYLLTTIVLAAITFAFSRRQSQRE